MNRFRVAALAFAVIGLGSAAAFIISQPRDELAAALLTATAEVGEVRLEVVGTGVIERDGLYALAFGQPQRRITEGEVSSAGGTTDSARRRDRPPGPEGDIDPGRRGRCRGRRRHPCLR